MVSKVEDIQGAYIEHKDWWVLIPTDKSLYSLVNMIDSTKSVLDDMCVFYKDE
jgi:hypothetical protein